VIELLAKAQASALKSEVLKIPLVPGLPSIRQLTSSRQLAAFLVAYYGGDLLEMPFIRQLLFSLLPVESLNGLCRSLGLPGSRFAYDAALILSTASWTFTSPLPRLVSAEIQKALGYPIPDEFMPSEPAPKPPTIEEIYSEELSPLFAYQRQVSNDVYALFASNGRAMVQMPTGSGKTRTVMHSLVRWFSSNTEDQNERNQVLWMAHSEELCEQAIATLKRSWSDYGEGSLTLYRLWGRHKMPDGELPSGVIIASLQKLHSLRTRADPAFSRLANDVRIVIFDEAHKALAPTYSAVISNLISGSDKTLLGLSATPGRAVLEAIENEKLANLFGNKLLSPDFGDRDPLAALRDMGVLAKIKRHIIRSPAEYALSVDERRFVSDFFDFPKSLLERIGQDEERNLLIVKAIIEQVRHNQQCIVFACSVEHGKILSAMVAMEGISSCSVSSDMRHSSRVRAIEGFRQKQFDVITNYGILTTGFDAPNVGAVVIARPTASIVLYSQMIGRGLRGPAVGGNPECNVLDVVDNIVGFGTEAEVYSYFSDYWN
jgi:DNA repair protein RadD